MTELSWLPRLPLFGKRVLVTRAREQAGGAAALLRERGADPVVVPTIEIHPPSDPSAMIDAVQAMHERYDWIVLTSANGVERLWAETKRQGKDARAFGKAKIAAIGPGTAAAFERCGLAPDVVAKEHRGEALAEEVLAAMNASGGTKVRVLVARAEVARDVVPDALRAAGCEVDVVSVYKTRSPPRALLEGLSALLEGGEIDAVTFTSSSTVEHLCDALEARARRAPREDLRCEHRADHHGNRKKARDPGRRRGRGIDGPGPRHGAREALHEVIVRAMNSRAFDRPHGARDASRRERMSLSSLIVQREIASIREVEEALARQVLYGGDLLTNLLEVARLDEAVLLPIVAESLGLPPAPSGELPRPEPDAQRLVAAEVAVERNLAPLSVDRYGLTVAVAEPLSADVEQELAFALALPISQRIAPLVRIKQALARDYGVPLDRRLQRLLMRMSSDGPRAPTLVPADARRRVPARRAAPAEHRSCRAAALGDRARSSVGSAGRRRGHARPPRGDADDAPAPPAPRRDHGRHRSRRARGGRRARHDPRSPVRVRAAVLRLHGRLHRARRGRRGARRVRRRRSARQGRAHRRAARPPEHPRALAREEGDAPARSRRSTASMPS